MSPVKISPFCGQETLKIRKSIILTLEVSLVTPHYILNLNTNIYNNQTKFSRTKYIQYAHKKTANSVANRTPNSPIRKPNVSTSIKAIVGPVFKRVAEFNTCPSSGPWQAWLLICDPPPSDTRGNWNFCSWDPPCTWKYHISRGNDGCTACARIWCGTPGEL